MISRKKWLAAAAGIAATLTFGTPAAMAGTVVAVTGPSAEDYPVGTQIGDTQRIRLQNGDRLTVLDSGRTRVFNGPGTFILASRGRTASSNAYRALTSQNQRTRARTGAVRTGTDGRPPQRPFLWYVDLSVAGPVCVTDPTSIRLWRNNGEGDASYSIAPVAEPANSVDVSFPDGEVLAGWNSRLALTEGLIYAVSKNGSDEKVNIDFVFIDGVPEEPETLAATLIANGCTGQLEVLAERLMEN